MCVCVGVLPVVTKITTTTKKYLDALTKSHSHCCCCFFFFLYLNTEFYYIFSIEYFCIFCASNVHVHDSVLKLPDSSPLGASTMLNSSRFLVSNVHFFKHSKTFDNLLFPLSDKMCIYIMCCCAVTNVNTSGPKTALEKKKKEVF